MRDNLQDQFDKLLKHIDLTPPPGVWDRIETQLPGQPERQSGSGYRYAVALFFLLSNSLGFFLVYDRYLDNGGGDRLSRLQKIPDVGKPSNKSTTENPRKNPVKPAPNYFQTIIVPTNNNSVPELASVFSRAAHSHTWPKLAGSKPAIDIIQMASNGKPPVSGPAETDLTALGTAPLIKLSEYIPEIISERKRIRNNNLPEEPLLASAGIVPVRSHWHRHQVNTTLDPGNPMSLELSYLNDTAMDPERASLRKKRLDQFKTFDVVRGFHAGTFISLTNSWMSRKYDLLDHPGNRIDPKTYVGMAFGINAGYDINERWGLQFEFAIRNSKGLEFDEKCLYTGDVMHKQLRLWYMRFPLLVKYKLMQINRPSGRPIVLGVLAGPQVNVLYRKSLLVNNEKVPVSNVLINHADIGAIGGVDLDFYLHKNFFLTAGTRLSIASPLQRELPMTLQLGFTLQVNFRVPPKEKL